QRSGHRGRAVAPGLPHRRQATRRRSPSSQRRRPRTAGHLPRRGLPRRQDRGAGSRRGGHRALANPHTLLRVLAADLGAGSVRVVAVDLDAAPPAVTELHRVAHVPVRLADGSLRWDWQRLMDAVVHGLELGLAAGPVASIAIDTWGVDYGLLNQSGHLLSPPYSYRDSRTSSWPDVAASIGASHLYSTTGVQLMAINTIFQLAVHDRRELATARSLLMLPELVV